MSDTDVFKLINKIGDLKSEINTLNEKFVFLNKKAEVAPIVLLYNYVRDKNTKTKSEMFSMTLFFPNKDSIRFTTEQVVASDDEILTYTNYKWEHLCKISEIEKISFDNMFGGKHDYFEYELDK